MSPKVRLDLTVNESTKQFLQQFASEQGVSMSEMVDQLIVEHLMHMPVDEPDTRDISTAVFDMLKIQELQERVTHAIAEGLVWSFDQWCELAPTLDGEELYRLEGGGIIYLPTDSPHYGIIVADNLVDECHADVISTYGGDSHSFMLASIDAYLSWYEDTDGYHLDGLCIVPKGTDPKRADDSNDWTAPATWPEDKPEPWNE